MKLSIVVPVYNVEAYIAKCLDSCLHQDISQGDFEIIVVNDGSKDNSIKIAQSYVIKHPGNIRIVNRKNGGLSAARNTGLEYAQGEYVWFVDSDDWIEENVSSNLINILYENKLDVLCFGVKCYHNPTHIDNSISRTPKENILMAGKDFVSDVNMIPAAWSAIYRREFLIENHLKFYEGILHEDEEFTPRAYYLAKRIMYTHLHAYYYRQREGSIMKSSRNSQRAVDYIKIADSLYDFAIANTQKGSIQYYYFMQRINRQITQSLFYNTTATPPYSIYKKKKYFPLATMHLKCSLRDKLKYILVNLSPRLYSMIQHNINTH